MTRFDKITKDIDTFINWVLDTYNCVPEQLPCETSCRSDCGECFKNWLQEEVTDEQQ